MIVVINSLLLVNTRIARELLLRVELRTSSLPRMRSTTELKQQFAFKELHLYERETGLKPATPSLEG